jgi:hypothetical protein
MGLPHKTGTPYRSTSNSKIENLLGQLEMGARALLLQAGLPHTWWPQAGAYYASANNIVGKPGRVSPYARRAGHTFPGHLVPFGAALRAILPEMRVNRAKFAPKTTYCIFIGYHWNPGQSWAGDYFVSPVDDHTTGGRTNPRIIRVKGGLTFNVDRPWSFPVKFAFDAAVQEDLVQRQVHEMVQHLPAGEPNAAQREPGDDDDDDDKEKEDVDFEQQLFHEDDDPVDLTAPVAEQLAAERDESLTGLTPQQRARRVQDDAGHWAPRRGSTRPPYIHTEQW